MSANAMATLGGNGTTRRANATIGMRTTANGSTMPPTNATATTVTANATTTRRLPSGGHFRGSEQVHGALSRGEGVPEHYHVHVQDVFDARVRGHR